MDPNNGQSETGSESLKKLEDDLQKLSQEASATSQPAPTPVVNVEPVVEPSAEGVGYVQPVVASDPQPSQALPSEEPVTPTISKSPETPSTDKKGSPMLIISLVLVVVALLVAIAYVVGMKFFTPKTDQMACTLEAKVCEDGTSVGRSGPNCEFDACPAVVATPTDVPVSTATSSATPSSTTSPSGVPTTKPTSSPSGTPTGYY